MKSGILVVYKRSRSKCKFELFVISNAKSVKIVYSRKYKKSEKSQGIFKFLLSSKPVVIIPSSLFKAVIFMFHTI